MSGVKWNVEEKLEVAKLQKFFSPGDDILVGYPEGRPHHDSELSMDELAKILTFGNNEIPPRPFLEEGIFDKKNEITELVRQHYSSMVDGHEKKPTLKKIGAFAVGAVKEFVFGDYYRETMPNRPSTIRRKSRRQKGKVLLSDKPLIDTGDMINSTTYVVIEDSV